MMNLHHSNHNHQDKPSTRRPPTRSLASLAEPEVMAFDDDESEVMTTEGGAELLSLA